MKKVRLKSYGKVNMSLDVTGKRDNGYHDIETVMQKISLFDDVTVSWIKKDCEEVEIILTCDKKYLPTDSRNLAFAAAQIMVRKFSSKVGGGAVKIHIDKHIPVSAGLAGGSGNGAAVIVALNRLWELKLDTKELCILGAELGADVPFCILSQNTRYGCALCKGTGTELTPLKSRFKAAVLLVKPRFGVSTAEVYQGIDECSINKRPNNAVLTEGINKNLKNEIYENMVNVLEEYTLNRYQEVRDIKKIIAEQTSADKVLMTGSGPTVFALFRNVKSAKKACTDMRKKGYLSYWATTL